jgi:hypothetical protein
MAEDGRAAYMAWTEHYNGEGELSKRMVKLVITDGDYQECEQMDAAIDMVFTGDVGVGGTLWIEE